jgi:hypothetical protein
MLPSLPQVGISVEVPSTQILNSFLVTISPRSVVNVTVRNYCLVYYVDEVPHQATSKIAYLFLHWSICFPKNFSQVYLWSLKGPVGNKLIDHS